MPKFKKILVWTPLVIEEQENKTFLVPYHLKMPLVYKGNLLSN